MTDYSIRNKTSRRYSDPDLLLAVRSVSQANGSGYVSAREFESITDISEGTVVRRFGSWREFCVKAGLLPRYTRKVSREELLQNLDSVWLKLGRQPTAKEMKQPVSPISNSRYHKEFGKPWNQICVDFLEWKSGTAQQTILRTTDLEKQSAGKPSREPRSISLSVRYEVMKRDGFKCVICGASPATHLGCVLHVDHIDHWAKGGNSEAVNLRTLCAECNLGRGVRE